MSLRAQTVLAGAIPSESLLQRHLTDADHEDSVALHLEAPRLAPEALQRLMGLLLQGFIDQPSGLVSLLMLVRNQLVRPLGLRRSRLGCPVSSLLSAKEGARFAGRYPVLDQRVDPEQRAIEVVLGADDQHLRFRSCIGLYAPVDGPLIISLSTRVRTLNAFGRFYMRAIHTAHHRIIAPLMLRKAAAFALQRMSRETASV
jgi:hypothetical protein